MIIAAAGSSRHPLGFGRNPLLGLSDAESKLLAASIYGDIGGVLLPHRTNPPGKPGQWLGNRLVAGITRRWTGLMLEHLSACATRAFAERSASRPGVTLLSFGASHAGIVLGVVRQGLVNQLIIGSDLEEALAKALLDGEADGREALPIARTDKRQRHNL